jgi:hypothetical protein
VNVSVRGGRRVEIKGVPKAGWAPRLVHGEAVRQVNLPNLRDELHRRGFTQPQSITTEHADVTRLFANSSHGRLRREEWDRHVQEHERRASFRLAYATGTHVHEGIGGAYPCHRGSRPAAPAAAQRALAGV